MYHASRIFVVDDEPLIASTLAAILKMNGFSTEFFTDPMDALDATASRMPDLLISDVLMPGLSGVELAILMRERKPDLEVLLISGQAGTADLLAGARKRGHRFALLQKPFLPKVLLSNLLTIPISRDLAG